MDVRTVENAKSASISLRRTIPSILVSLKNCYQPSLSKCIHTHRSNPFEHISEGPEHTGSGEVSTKVPYICHEHCAKHLSGLFLRFIVGPKTKSEFEECCLSRPGVDPALIEVIEWDEDELTLGSDEDFDISDEDE